MGLKAPFICTMAAAIASSLSMAVAQPMPPNQPDGPSGRQFDGPNRGAPAQRPGLPRDVAPDRQRHFRDIVIMRPHGPWLMGYGPYHDDAAAYQWLAFTAITLALMDMLNESQQRAHEAAQIHATTAPIGERIVWSDGAAKGSVVALREGTTTTGRYCREFQQTVTIGGKSEQAYGTACRQPDGAWEIVSTS